MKRVLRPRRPLGILAHELPRATRVRYGKVLEVVVTYHDGSVFIVEDGTLLHKDVLLRTVWRHLPRSRRRTR
jgi:hypothetical protein